MEKGDMRLMRTLERMLGRTATVSSESSLPAQRRRCCGLRHTALRDTGVLHPITCVRLPARSERLSTVSEKPAPDSPVVNIVIDMSVSACWD